MNLKRSIKNCCMEPMDVDEFPGGYPPEWEEKAFRQAWERHKHRFRDVCEFRKYYLGIQ